MRANSKILVTLTATAVTAATLVLSAATPAVAHEEREAIFPDKNVGSVPEYRTFPQAQRVVVCAADSAQRIAALPGEARTRSQALLGECAEDSIQDAVNTIAAPGGLGANSTIYLLPGVYLEEKYAAPPTGACAEIQPEGEGDVIGSLQGSEEDNAGVPALLSYAQQLQCPNVHNLIAIMGDQNPDDTSYRCDSDLCGLQIEGTGERPDDVVVDNRFAKLNAIRADRADGLYLRNFLVQQSRFNSVYIIETTGFVVDKMVARANDEYGFLAFASDRGLIKDCEAYYNGDSGVYPGSASDINADRTTIDVERYAIEITRCYSHDNALGYSGTAGNSVYAHDNVFSNNATGIATDSFFPGHPGLPQDHARFSNNKIFSNNRNYYDFVRDGTCAKPIEERGYLEKGVVCPVIPTPVGTGIIIAGGNLNSVDNNLIYDNWRAGTYQIWVPAALRDEFDPTKQYDTSNGNQYRDNRMGFAPDGAVQPNGLDSFWDDEGVGNCWQGNVSSWGDYRSNAVDPRGLPTCDSGGSQFVPGTSAVKFTGFLGCSQYNRDDEFFRDPPACDWFTSPVRPASTDAGADSSGGSGDGASAGGGTSAGAGTDASAAGGSDAVRGRSLPATGVSALAATVALLLLGAGLWLRRKPRTDAG